MKYEYYFRITSSNALKKLKEDFKKKTKVVQTNHHHLLKNQKCSSKSIAENWQCYRKSYKEKMSAQKVVQKSNLRLWDLFQLSPQIYVLL